MLHFIGFFLVNNFIFSFFIITEKGEFESKFSFLVSTKDWTTLVSHYTFEEEGIEIESYQKQLQKGNNEKYDKIR